MVPRPKGSRNKKQTPVTCGHPERPHIANSRCASCHAIHWRNENPERFKEIARKNKLRRRYDISPEQYNEMFERQGGVCALCYDPPSLDRRLAVDHSALTSEVRGLLCDPCNRKMLGRMEKKNIPLLRIAEYLYGGKLYKG